MWNNEIGIGKKIVCYGSGDIRPTLLKDFQQLRIIVCYDSDVTESKAGKQMCVQRRSKDFCWQRFWSTVVSPCRQNPLARTKPWFGESVATYIFHVVYFNENMLCENITRHV